MEQVIVKLVKVQKGNKTYTNFYLFGKPIKPVNPSDFSALYYQVKEHLRANNVEIPLIVKNDVLSEVEDKKAK